jgi:hypothetical protein
MSKKPKARKAAAKPGASRDIKLSEHPRARRQIRLAKGWSALAACSLAAYLSWHGGAPFVDTSLRAILWGIVAYLVAWACAQQLWRQFAVAELRAAEKRALERRREAEEAERARDEQAAAERAAAATAGGR